jgi:hypothetical protein
MQAYNKKYWPHQFRMLPEPDAWQQAYRLETFCIDNFDRSTWRNNGLYFAFKREQDATHFLLRWGG